MMKMTIVNAQQYQIIPDMICDCNYFYYAQGLLNLPEEDKTLSGDISEKNLVVGR